MSPKIVISFIAFILLASIASILVVLFPSEESTQSTNAPSSTVSTSSLSPTPAIVLPITPTTLTVSSTNPTILPTSRPSRNPTVPPTRIPTTNPSPLYLTSNNENVNDNLGFLKLVLVPIEFETVKWGENGNREVPRAALATMLSSMQEWFFSRSLEQVLFVGKDNNPVINITDPFLLNPGTASNCDARAKVKNQVTLPGFHARIAIYPRTICDFANFGGGWVHLSSIVKSTSVTTLRHELGHSLGLAHANSLIYKDGIFQEEGEYNDYTSQMGDNSAPNFNAPMHFWLGWFRNYEVQKVEMLLGQTTRIRAIDNYNLVNTDVAAAFVFKLNHSDDYLFFSLLRKSSGIVSRRYFQNNDAGIAVHLASQCRFSGQCGFYRSALHTIFRTSRVDETGLIINVSYPNTANYNVADVTFNYDSRFDICSNIPDVFVTVLAVTGTRRANIRLEIIDNNPVNCRPFFVTNRFFSGVSGTQMTVLPSFYQSRSTRCSKYVNQNIGRSFRGCFFSDFSVSSSSNTARVVLTFRNRQRTYCLNFQASTIALC